MITTVTLNPAIDKTSLINAFEYGSVNRIVSTRIDAGGKGINVSKVIHLLGGKTTAIGFIGKQNENIILDFLEEKGIAHDFVGVNAPIRENIKIVDENQNRTTEFNESGFYVHPEELDTLKKRVLFYAKQSQIIVFSGSVPKGVPVSIYKDLIALAKPYCATVLDADGELLTEGIKAGPFLVKPNKEELASAYHINCEHKNLYIKVVKEMMTKYGVEHVLISMGKEGSLLIHNHETYQVSPIKVHTKSSVGAGDSMVGGFVATYIKTQNLIESLKAATACGTLAVTTQGTQLFETDAVNNMVSRVEINRINPKLL